MCSENAQHQKPDECMWANEFGDFESDILGFWNKDGLAIQMKEPRKGAAKEKHHHGIFFCLFFYSAPTLIFRSF